MPTLEILYQDEHYIAIHKPAGLLVHRTAIDSREQVFALQLLRDQIGKYIFPVHRLDKPTSGVLLFALEVEANRRIKQLFDTGEIGKRYVAVVRGYTAVSGRIDHPISRKYDKKEGRTRLREPQPAQTDYERLATAELPIPTGRYETARYSLLTVAPITGRRHQIRRHMAHISHPIVGDSRYGDSTHNRLFRHEFGCHRLLLAAVALTFVHPFRGRQVEITAPLAADFRDVCVELGWNDQLLANGV